MKNIMISVNPSAICILHQQYKCATNECIFIVSSEKELYYTHFSGGISRYEIFKDGIRKSSPTSLKHFLKSH